MSNSYSPEQLVELVNAGKSISELSVISDSEIEPHARELGCSFSQVKDVVFPSTTPEVTNLQTRPFTVGDSSRQGKEEKNEIKNSRGGSLNQTVSENTETITVTNVSEGQKELDDTTSRKAAAISYAKFDGVDIKNPVELLLLLDENILSGATKLHKWQKQFMIDFANPEHTKESPFQAVVQACNSSGKDKYIIAACAVWLCMRYREVECPITSSSGNQLDNQTGAHIDRLTSKANAVFGKLWKINYRYYEFQHVGEMGEPMPSKLKLFATDEPGKAEGYHPVDAGKKMAIFTSETKSIPEDITEALERCTGFTHRVDASSPGAAAGYFYNTCSAALPREDIDDIKSLTSVQTILYKVTAYQCSHITTSEIERIAAKLSWRSLVLLMRWLLFHQHLYGEQLKICLREKISLI